MELSDILLAALPFGATAFSAWLVYRADKGEQILKNKDQMEAQRQAEVDRLREDLHQADELYRKERNRSAHYARLAETYRFWGYSLRRMLAEDGMSETLIPPEPTNGEPQ